jgi:two-component system OmpR family response regulator
VKKQVLVVDDDLNICREIKDALQDATTDVQYILPAEKILPEYMRQPFCIVIMDISLASINGIALLETMRQAKPIPILVLSPVNNTADRVKLLQAGATTVLKKPCDIAECLANAQSLMHIYLHSGSTEQGCYTLAFEMDLIIDPSCRKVILKGKELDLTRREFDLLYYLACRSGQVLSREQIYNAVWHSEADYNVDESVKSCIKTLRKKLISPRWDYIQNVRGVGYRFSVPH